MLGLAAEGWQLGRLDSPLGCSSPTALSEAAAPVQEMSGQRIRTRPHLSLLFVLLRVCKLDHDGGGAPLHCDAVVHRLDRNHRNLEIGIALKIQIATIAI